MVKSGERWEMSPSPPEWKRQAQRGESMFMGEYKHTIDAKGRLIIPSKFREELGQAFYITRGLDGCLFIFPQDQWKDFEEKLRKLPLIDKNSRKFSRFFLSGASPCELDRQGRILVPSILRDYAKMDKEVIFSGMLDRIEVWSKEKWSMNNSYEEEDMDKIAASMQAMGLSI